MTLFHAFILSVVEGITEFLPISSTGHMILVSNFLGIANTDFVKSFEIIIQLGAISAVCILYFKKLFLNKQVFLRVCVAFLPTAFVGFVLYKFIKTYLLGNPWIVVISLGVGGILLILLELIYKEKAHHVEEINSISLQQALFIGISQSFSIIPGVSRSAATIVGALLAGIKRNAAVEFSFLLAIPTMAAATGLDLVENANQFTRNQYTLLFISFICAFITALVAVKWFIAYVKNHTFIPFGIYRIILALAYYLYILR